MRYTAKPQKYRQDAKGESLKKEQVKRVSYDFNLCAFAGFIAFAVLTYVTIHFK
jgi:hypothetical protein